MSLKDKYRRPTPEQIPSKKKGNSDVISKMINSNPINTGIQETVYMKREVKKATFELDVTLHKRLRIIAAANETTMLDLVEKAIIEYLDKIDN